jgi:hypothetical protein
MNIMLLEATPNSWFHILVYMRKSCGGKKKVHQEILWDLHVLSAPEHDKIIFVILSECMYLYVCMNVRLASA